LKLDDQDSKESLFCSLKTLNFREKALKFDIYIYGLLADQAMFLAHKKNKW